MAASFSVTVDHTTIGRDHTFQLAARLAGKSDDFMLDVTPLAKSFYVTAEPDAQRAGLWRVKRYRLGAKRTGQLRVPALTAIYHGRKLVSQPFSVKVLKTEGDVDDVRLWVEDGVDRKQAWLHQQLAWHMTVFSTYPFMGAPHVRLPDFDGFDVLKVDAGVSGEQVMYGRRVFAASWHALLFPRRAGDLHIARPAASARLLQMVKTHRFAAGNPNFDAGEKRVHEKTARGSERHIRVRALPVAAEHLPVGRLEISSDIPDPHAYVAEPLTWSIHLTGKGMRKHDLPDLHKHLLLHGLFKTVREKPLVTVHRDKHRTSVEALYRIVLSPSRQGKLRLPGMDVPFFNPDGGQVEHVSLSPRLLTVLPQRMSARNEGFEIGGAGASRHARTRTGDDASVRWKALAIGMFALWLITLAAWLFSSRARLAAGYIFSRGHRVRAASSLRRALVARNAGEQFAAIKDALALSGSMTPLGLLAYAPDLRDGETGAWLDALERARWQGGNKPRPLDSTCVRNMARIIQASVQHGDDMGLQAFNPADFGRIGA